MCFSTLKLKQSLKVLRYCISSTAWDLKQIIIMKLIVDASFNWFFKSLQEISGAQAFLQTLQRSAWSARDSYQVPITFSAPVHILCFWRCPVSQGIIPCYGEARLISTLVFQITLLYFKDALIMFFSSISDRSKLPLMWVIKVHAVHVQRYIQFSDTFWLFHSIIKYN